MHDISRKPNKEIFIIEKKTESCYHQAATGKQC